MGLISDGTTIFDAGALDSGLAKGALTFIKKLSASTSNTLTFHNGASSVVLDNTYKEYLFTFNNIHMNTDSARFQFQANVVGGADFNETMTTTLWHSQHNQAGSFTRLAYGSTSYDQAEGTAFQNLSSAGPADGNAERSQVGTIRLFNPSSTTFVKHFISEFNDAESDDYCTTVRVAGYFNTTAAIDEVRFQGSTGNFNGDICLYGIA